MRPRKHQTPIATPLSGTAPITGRAPYPRAILETLSSVSHLPAKRSRSLVARALLALLLVLALAQPLAADPSHVPLMIEVHKGRVFANLDHHVGNVQRYLANAGRYRAIDRARVFEQRLVTRGIGDFGAGQRLQVVGPNGVVGSCSLTRFAFLTRGYVETPTNDHGDLLPLKKPICGEPVLFAELHCSQQTIATLAKRERFVAFRQAHQVTTQKLEPSKNPLLRRTCLADPQVVAAHKKAQKLASAQKQPLRTEVRTVPVKLPNGATLWLCQVSFTTREGDTSCGNDDVSLHLLGVWRAKDGRLSSVTRPEPSNEPWTLHYAATVDGELGFFGTRDLENGYLSPSRSKLELKNSLQFSSCVCRC